MSEIAATEKHAERIGQQEMERNSRRTQTRKAESEPEKKPPTDLRYREKVNLDDFIIITIDRERPVAQLTRTSKAISPPSFGELFSNFTKSEPDFTVFKRWIKAQKGLMKRSKKKAHQALLSLIEDRIGELSEYVVFFVPEQGENGDCQMRAFNLNTGAIKSLRNPSGLIPAGAKIIFKKGYELP